MLHASIIAVMVLRQARPANNLPDRGPGDTIMSKRAYAIIIASFFTVSLAYTTRYAYGMLLPEMMPDWGVSKTQAGVVFAAYFVVYTICTPAMGTFSDLFSYRLLITLFTAVVAVGALLMAFADSFSAGMPDFFPSPAWATRPVSHRWRHWSRNGCRTTAGAQPCLLSWQVLGWGCSRGGSCCLSSYPL